ncbi:MAG: response regulator [Cyclobacteriaceae bacterium]|jgi:DNA-binding response OmpR family regulator
MNIYLIEDDLIYAEFIKKSLGLKPGYKITHFDSAEKALEAMKSGIPDALIVDYKLPGMSGIEFFETIKGQIKDSHKVIMLSALDDGNMVLSFIQKGVRDYVIKDESVIESLTAVLDGNDDDYLFN